MLPTLPARPAGAEPRNFFFDLADPEKRTREDLLEVLCLIARFGAFGRVTLGLILKEAQQVAVALGVCTSGHYVRTAQSPTLDDLEKFLTNWA